MNKICFYKDSVINRFPTNLPAAVLDNAKMNEYEGATWSPSVGFSCKTSTEEFNYILHEAAQK
jgi:hypothetical protein